MIFSFDNAKEIVQNYQCLIGDTLIEEVKISEIVIVPAEIDKYTAFRLKYSSTRDKLVSLIHSKFDPLRVRIEIFAWHNGNLLVKDFDDFLSIRLIRKVY